MSQIDSITNGSSLEEYLEHLSISESRAKHRTEILIKDYRKFQKQKLDLKDGQGIERLKSSLLEKFSRENIVYFGRVLQEKPILVENTRGDLVVSLIDEEIGEEKILQIKNKQHRDKIGYLHVGNAQILIQSTFRNGIDSPISLLVIDNRIVPEKDKIIGFVHGNLAVGKLKFEVKFGYGIPITTRNLSNSISIVYDFKRRDLMEEGDHPFSVTFALGYALTNSHSSLTYPNEDRISIDQIFKGVAVADIPRNIPLRKTMSMVKREKLEAPTLYLEEQASTSKESEEDKVLQTVSAIRNEIRKLSEKYKRHIGTK